LVIEPVEPSPTPGEPAGDGKPKRRRYTRHNLTPPRAKLKLMGFGVIDRRTASARAAIVFRDHLIAQLGGPDEITPAQAKLIDLAARTGAMLDHIDAWLLAQDSLIDTDSRTLLPVVYERQAVSAHLAKLLKLIGIGRRVKPIPTIDELLRAQQEPA
jgi:hypothetical protein